MSKEGPPVKRRRLSTQESSEVNIVLENKTKAATMPPVQTHTNDEEQLEKERRVGINAYVNPEAPGFSGVLKQRYTDFLVNEVLPNGEVLHLENLQPPKRKQIKDDPEPINAAPAAKVEQPLPAEVNGEEGKEDGTEADAQDDVKISDEDTTALQAIFGQETLKQILQLYNAILRHPAKKPRDFRSVISEVIPDKDARTKAHQEVRRIFRSKVETKTNESDNTIAVTAPPLAVKGRGGDRVGAPRKNQKQSWAELGGDYVHFTLYKENKDTMEAVYFLASQMKTNVKAFQFGGTKDRRGVTVQKVSAYRLHADQLASVGRRLRGSKIGDYEYRKHGLELGELGGNEFVITLRDCHFPGQEGLEITQRLELANKVINDALESFRKGGFINYYGLQRFGSFSTSTDTIGTKLLQGDLKGAVDDILTFNPALIEVAETRRRENVGYREPMPNGMNISQDDLDRAEAINIWYTTQDAFKAGQKLPRKFSAEANIIRHLGFKDRKPNAPNNGLSRLNDYQGALQMIPRNLRLMYVHAYQSLVWNVVAGERWKRFGASVVEGDLVLESEYNIKLAKPDTTSEAAPSGEAVDESGEPIISAAASAGDDSADASADTDTIYARAHALTAEDLAMSPCPFSITDIVLPLPGYDVIYPPNDMGKFYKDFMASETGGKLDPYDMRRSWKDMSLSGGYRKVVVRPAGEVTAEVRAYQREDEQMVETDAERLDKKKTARMNGQNGKEVKEEDGASEEVKQATQVQGEDAMQGVELQASEVNFEEKAKATFGDLPQRIAVILRLRLNPSQYATMALRELMKAGGVKTYKPDFGGGR